MNTKEFILKTAFQLFLEKGYKGTSMSELVKETGLSKGSLYHHFESKEVLYQKVIDKYFLSFKKETEIEKIRNKSLDEFESITKEFINTFLDEINKLTNRGLSAYFAMFFEALTIYPAFKTDAIKFYSKFKSVLEEKYISEKGFDKNKARIKAIEGILKIEGLFFWLSLFNDENIDGFFNTD